MVDGLDVLFRVALGILRSNEQELLQCESNSAVYVSLENLPTRMWQSDKLLQASSFVALRVTRPTDAWDILSLNLILETRSHTQTSSEGEKHTFLHSSLLWHRHTVTIERHTVHRIETLSAYILRSV